MTDFPKAPPEKDESRYIACQMAVETVLQDLVEDAMRRGWEETEVLSAITEVADNLMLAVVSALEAAGGTPELPFTDLIRDRKGRDIIRNALLSLTWQIKTDANAGYVLGDAAVSYEKSDLGSGLRAPLSKTTALYLTPSQTPQQGIANTTAKPFEVDDLNYESAARARLWLVGEQARIHEVRTQVTARGLPAV